MHNHITLPSLLPPPSFALSTTMYNKPATSTQEDLRFNRIRNYSLVQDQSTSFGMSRTQCKLALDLRLCLAPPWPLPPLPSMPPAPAPPVPVCVSVDVGYRIVGSGCDHDHATPSSGSNGQSLSSLIHPPSSSSSLMGTSITACT